MKLEDVPLALVSERNYSMRAFEAVHSSLPVPFLLRATLPMKDVITRELENDRACTNAFTDTSLATTCKNRNDAYCVIASNAKQSRALRCSKKQHNKLRA